MIEVKLRSHFGHFAYLFSLCFVSGERILIVAVAVGLIVVVMVSVLVGGEEWSRVNG
jgi:uncharacterized membrane protein